MARPHATMVFSKEEQVNYKQSRCNQGSTLDEPFGVASLNNHHKVRLTADLVDQALQNCTRSHALHTETFRIVEFQTLELLVTIWLEYLTSIVRKMDFSKVLKKDNYSVSYDKIGYEESFYISHVFVEVEKKLIVFNYVRLLSARNGWLQRRHLSLNRAKNFAIFPGQVVVVEGAKRRADLEVERFWTTRQVAACQAPVGLAAPLSIVVALAPFTAPENLAFDQLKLLEYCKEHSPDVLLLTGPFLDADNADTLAEMAVPFHRHFAKVLGQLVNNLAAHVLVVAPHKDVNSVCVYRTPAYRINRRPSNLHLLPDPCVVEMNGRPHRSHIDHLEANEFFNGPGDRVKRLVGHLFNKKRFCPLRQTAAGVPFDAGLGLKYHRLVETPNLLVLPGTLTNAFD